MSDFSKLSDADLEAYTNDEFDKISPEGRKIIEVAENPISPVEATVRGAAAGASFNFSDEIEAGVRTLINEESYSDNLVKARELNDQAQAENPGIYGVASFAGAVLSPVNKIGIVGRGASLAKNMAGGATLGAIAGAGAADSMEELPMSVIFGGGLGAAGGAVSKGLEVGLDKLGEVARNIKSHLLFGSNKTGNTERRLFLERTGQTHEGFVKSLDDVMVDRLAKDGTLKQERLFVQGDTLVDTAEKTQAALQQVGKQLGKTIDDLDSVVKVETDDLDRLLNNLKENSKVLESNAETTEMKSIYSRLRDKIDNDFYKVATDEKTGQVIIDPLTLQGTPTAIRVIDPKKASIKKLNAIKQEWNKLYTKFDGDSKLHTVSKWREVTHSLGEEIDDLISKSKDVPEDLLNKYTKARNLYGNLKIYDKAVVNSIDSSTNGAYSSYRDALSVMAAGTAGGSAPMMAVAAIRGVSKSSTVGLNTGILMGKLANAIEARGSGGRHIVERLQAAAAVSATQFRITAQAEYAKINLEESPLDRTVRDVINRQDDILFLAQSVNPKLASQLKQAIDEGEDEMIASTLNQISKLPGASKYFKEGIGFDGKLWDEDDKMRVLQTSNSMDVSAKQRAEVRQIVNQPGVVKTPVLRQEEDPFEIFIRKQSQKKPKPEY